MLIANVVADVFLCKKFQGTYSLYIRKRVTNVLVLVAMIYEEWHAILLRRYVRGVYGLNVNEVSKEDCMYQIPIREHKVMAKVQQLNLTSSNKTVRQHAAMAKQLAGDLLEQIKPESPADKASRLLYEMDRKSK